MADREMLKKQVLVLKKGDDVTDAFKTCSQEDLLRAT
jgi:hypothetical protein